MAGWKIVSNFSHIGRRGMRPARDNGCKGRGGGRPRESRLALAWRGSPGKLPQQMFSRLFYLRYQKEEPRISRMTRIKTFVSVLSVILTVFFFAAREEFLGTVSQLF
jgi:hypothetical protein